MSDKSLNDKVIRLLTALEQLDKAMAGVSDYGEVTGFCDEHGAIASELDAALGAFSERVHRLSRRIRLHKEAQEQNQ